MTVSIHKQTSCHLFIMGLIELTLILEHTKKWSKLGQRRNEKNSSINEEKNGHQDGSEGKGSNTNLYHLSSISGIHMVKGVKRSQQGVLWPLYICHGTCPSSNNKGTTTKIKDKQMNEQKVAAATLSKWEFFQGWGLMVRVNWWHKGKVKVISVADTVHFCDVHSHVCVYIPLTLGY